MAPGSSNNNMPQPSAQRDGNFKVLKFLGKGSYGSVFQVQRLKEPGAFYALKEMDVRAMNQAEREDAANEVRLMASVSHPNIISYNEAFLDGNRLCIIMEYAPDGDLARLIKKHQAMKKPLAEDLIWRFFIQIARGLQALHHMQILHRDVKPGNMMILEGNILKIGDLGIAKLLKHTMAKTQIGTPHYMPPEVWRSRPYGFSSDSWALGCILYEMTTLNVPFVAKSMSELRYKVLKGSYPPLSSGYSRDLHTMVKECLDQNPDRRPNMDQILNSEIVRKRLHLLPSEVRTAPPGSAASVMLSTIKVPKNFQLIKNKLPGPVYPGVGMAAVAEEDYYDDDVYHRPAADQMAGKLPSLGGAPAPPDPYAAMQYKNAPVSSMYDEAQQQQQYRAPLPAIRASPQQQRRYDQEEAQPAYQGKPQQLPSLQSFQQQQQQQQQPEHNYHHYQHRESPQQQQQRQQGYTPPSWQHQHPAGQHQGGQQQAGQQQAGVSESRATYGAFYRAPSSGGGQSAASPSPQQQQQRQQQQQQQQQQQYVPPASYLYPQQGGGAFQNILPSRHYGGSGEGGGGGPSYGANRGGGGRGAARLPSIIGNRRDKDMNRQGGGGGAGRPSLPPLPWNFAGGKQAGARNGGGRLAGGGGGGGGGGGDVYGEDMGSPNGGMPRYPPPQWSAPKAGRW